MSGRLTEAQRRALRYIASKPFGAEVYIAGRNVCKALHRKGLIANRFGDTLIINRHYDGNPTVEITEAGRRALQRSTGEPG